jgi:hypothetical protein
VSRQAARVQISDFAMPLFYFFREESRTLLHFFRK